MAKAETRTKALLAAVLMAALALAAAGCGVGEPEIREAAPEQGACWALYYEDGTGTYTLDTTGRDDAEPAVLKAGVKLAVAEPGGGVSCVVTGDSASATVPKAAVLDGQVPQAGDVLVIATSEDGVVGGTTEVECESVSDSGDSWEIEGAIADGTKAYEVAPGPDLMRSDVDELYMHDDEGEESAEDEEG